MHPDQKHPISYSVWYFHFDYPLTVYSRAVVNNGMVRYQQGEYASISHTHLYFTLHKSTKRYNKIRKTQNKTIQVIMQLLKYDAATLLAIGVSVLTRIA